MAQFWESTAWKKGVRTFAQSFLGLFLISMVGFLNDLVLWANGGEGHVFPHISVLLRATVAASASAFIATISFLQNLAEDKVGKDTPLLPRS